MLDQTNERALVGLKKLEKRAEKLAKELELAAQRGEPGICDRWRAITRMTQAGSDVHRRARERVKQGC